MNKLGLGVGLLTHKNKTYRNVKIKLNQIVCTSCKLTCEVVLRKLSVYIFIKYTLSQMAFYHSTENFTDVESF